MFCLFFVFACGTVDLGSKVNFFPVKGHSLVGELPNDSNQLDMSTQKIVTRDPMLQMLSRIARDLLQIHRICRRGE
jgi:hypothetical protein